MKRKELLIIGFTAFIAAIISFVLSGMLFGTPAKNTIKVPVVDKISSQFPSPATDEEYQVFYNDKALNPTQLIQIGGDSNTAPFTGISQ